MTFLRQAQDERWAILAALSIGLLTEELDMPYAGLDLTGRKALVTGGARGIGATLAVGLAQAGADVAVCDLGSDETWEGLSNTVWQIRNCGQVGLAVDLDVQDIGGDTGRRSGRWRTIWAGWTSW